MIQAGFFSVFNFIANNKAAQIVLTVGLILFAWMLNNRHQRRIGARETEARIEKKSRRVQARIEEKLDEKSTQTARARDDAPRGVTASDGVPDDLRELILSD